MKTIVMSDTINIISEKSLSNLSKLGFGLKTTKDGIPYLIEESISTLKLEPMNDDEEIINFRHVSN